MIAIDRVDRHSSYKPKLFVTLSDFYSAKDPCGPKAQEPFPNTHTEQRKKEATDASTWVTFYNRVRKRHNQIRDALYNPE